VDYSQNYLNKYLHNQNRMHVTNELIQCLIQVKITLNWGQVIRYNELLERKMAVLFFKNKKTMVFVWMCLAVSQHIYKNVVFFKELIDDGLCLNVFSGIQLIIMMIEHVLCD
jgi:hypothetical protein